MIKTIIVDDEPLALDILEAFIEKIPNVELVARCENAFEANDILNSESVDLMFLDIQMPQLSGVDFLKSLTNPPVVIFTTAFSEYAVEAYELNVADYLLKPISMDRFMKSINKATELINQSGSKQSDDGDADYFYVKADKKLVKINFDDIIYIEGLKDYVIIKQEVGRTITLQTMKSLEQKLPVNHFRRVHRSYIVNTKKIKALDGNSLEVIEKGSVKILPIGKNYRDELLKQINEMKL